MKVRKLRVVVLDFFLILDTKMLDRITTTGYIGSLSDFKTTESGIILKHL
jgi:hypothetical protein